MIYVKLNDILFLKKSQWPIQENKFNVLVIREMETKTKLYWYSTLNKSSVSINRAMSLIRLHGWQGWKHLNMSQTSMAIIFRLLLHRK